MGNEIFNPYKKFSKNDESQIKEEINVKKSFEEFNLDNLVPFKNQPFKVYSNDEMKELKDSIERIGLQNSIIVRRLENNKYEILAGHNRARAFKELGKEKIPAIIQDVDDDTAQMIMIDTNIVQRQNMTTMERAKAYKLKDEIKKRKRYDIDKVEENLSDEEKEQLASEESRQTFYRYLSLTNLIPEYQAKCDDESLSVRAGEQLSKLNEQQQRKIYEALGDSKITENKAEELRKLANTFDEFTVDIIKENFNGDKNTIKSSIKFTKKEMEKYFSDFKSIKEIKEYLIRLLEEIDEKSENSPYGEKYY